MKTAAYSQFYTNWVQRTHSQVVQMGLKLQNTTRQEKASPTAAYVKIINIIVVHLLALAGNWAYLTDKLSTHIQSQWGFDGRNKQLCSPHVQAVATPAVYAAQSQAGTPTVQKTPSSTQSPFYRKSRWMRQAHGRCTVLLPKGIVPGQLFVVSSGTILQLYHKPTKQTFELGLYMLGQRSKFKYYATEPSAYSVVILKSTENVPT